MLTLAPILIDEDPTQEKYANEYCKEIFKSYPSYYYKTGYNPPWIGYFVMRDETVVGVGGFVGKPINGNIEIAYGTRKEYEKQGIATFTCGQLIAIAKATDPTVIITAKTLPKPNPSTTVLQRNGFVFTGITQDDDIGDAWLWTHAMNNLSNDFRGA